MPRVGSLLQFGIPFNINQWFFWPLAWSRPFSRNCVNFCRKRKNDTNTPNSGTCDMFGKSCSYYEVRPLTIQPCRLCCIVQDSDDSIESTTWILLGHRKGSDNVAFLLLVMNTLRMKSEHVVDVDLFERKNRSIEVSTGHLLGVERI